MNIAREFVGGPFDGELIALTQDMHSVRIPLPRQWRKDPRIAECVIYRLKQDHMRFQARLPNPDPLLTDSQV